MTLCLVYKTKCSDQSSDTIRDAIKNKLSTCSLCWDPSDICTETRNSCFNQTCQSERSFTPFVRLTTDTSAWTVSESECASVYCIQCRQDSGSDCKFLFAFDTRIQHDQVSAVKRVNASRQGLWWEDDCSGGCVYANVCAQVTSPCPSDPKLANFGAWLNKCIVYNEEDILSYETCRKLVLMVQYKDLSHHIVLGTSQHGGS